MTSNCQCGSHPPAKPQALELAKLEAVLADCRAKKAKAKPGTPALIACMSERLTGPTASAAAAAVSARLDAGKAMLAAAEAKARAKQAAAALKSDPLADQSDSQLQFVAGHRSASPADAQAAKTALESRGWTVHPNGAFSQSTVRQPRR
jgi:cell pole-organizing protein PopZ